MTTGKFTDSERNSYVKNYLENQLHQFGELSYVYSVINKRNIDEVMIISNLPDTLVADYIDKKKQSIDPVIINALNRFTSISWDENLEINSQWTMKKVFDPVKPYNINSGHAFILHDHLNNLAVLSIYIDKYFMSETENLIRSNKDKFQGILMQSHEILLQVYQDKCNKSYTELSLSLRESEILYWCATGKTYPEVASILQLTVSTIKFHMSKIVKKLGVKNAKHAISLSVEIGIISPPGRDRERFQTKITR